MSTHPATQVRYPWRATARTVFQFIVALAAGWALIVEALGVDASAPWLATSLAIAAAITRVMALPVVDALLSRYLPFLAATSPGDPDDAL